MKWPGCNLLQPSGSCTKIDGAQNAKSPKSKGIGRTDTY